MSKIIKVKRTVTVTSTSKWPESYLDGQTLDSALNYERDLSKGDHIQGLITDLEFKPEDQIDIAVQVTAEDE